MMNYNGLAPVFWQLNSPTWSNHHGFEKEKISSATGGQ